MPAFAIRARMFSTLLSMNQTFQTEATPIGNYFLEQLTLKGLFKAHHFTQHEYSPVQIPNTYENK